MYAYVKNQFVYLNIPRNGSNTFGRFFANHGWERINLFENDLDLSKMVIFGHLTNPETRHTKGLAMYIRITQINYNHPEIAKIIVSGVFDEHTCSLNMMLGKLWYLPIHWIPLDLTVNRWVSSLDKVEQLDGNDFTNIFFAEQGLDLKISDNDIKNTVVPEEIIIRNKITEYKQVYNKQYQQIVKNFFEPDMILYDSVLKKYRDRYES